MHDDNQHLDFLISQHVDGCLDGAGKKSVEQHLLTNPDARKLYQEQREVQDVLDDWGSRIPMINWQEFDQQLATRLENESVGGQKQPGRRWYKPLAAAAALFIAASLGYGWHAVSGNAAAVTPGAGPVATLEPARITVGIEGQSGGVASSGRVRIDEAPGAILPGDKLANAVSVGAPGDVAALESLRDSVMSGLSNLGDAPGQHFDLQSRPGSASAMNGFEQRHDDGAGDRESLAPLP